MKNVDCLIIGNNTGNFDQYIRERKEMGTWNGAYRDAQINSILLNGRRISYMDLFNSVQKHMNSTAEDLSAFDPLGLAGLHLASFLCRNGANVELVGDFQKSKKRIELVLREAPLSVAITTTFYFETRPVNEIVSFVRLHSPGTKIVVGGPYIAQLERSTPADVLQTILRDIDADIYVVDSQGELTLARVIHTLRRGGSSSELMKIPNLLILQGGKIIRTEREPEDNPINSNRVNWSLFDPAALRPFTMIRTAISCPFSCSFCSYPVRAGEHRLADVETVESDLRTLDEIGVEYVYFIDDTFNVPLPRFKELCRMMAKNRFRFRWLSYFRCGNMDEEAVTLAASSGCVGALLGIESGDERVLRLMNKFAHPEKYRQAIRWLEDQGIMTWALCFVGFPGDNQAAIGNTISLLKDAAPSFYATQMWFYDTATPIHQRAQEFKLQGSGYGWRHSSMTWREASAGVDAMLREVRSPIYVPQTAFSFETIFYLMGRGFRLEFIKQFLRISQDMVVNGLGDGGVDQTPHLHNLFKLWDEQRALFARDRLPLPPIAQREIQIL